jgi:hypothetical protein
MSRWKIAGSTVLSLVVASSLSFAAAAKTYQVTGPVLALTDDTITVEKGTDRWEIARDASTKVTGTLKVGAKVTIEYRMSATSVEVKPDGEKPAAKKPSK